MIPLVWRRRATLAVVTLVALATVRAAVAQSALNTSMLRLDLDNDAPLRKDEGYSSGLSLQYHSAPRANWNSAFARRAARLFGLDRDGDESGVVRWTLGVTQQMFTPHDIAVASPPEKGDMPWAGIIGAHVTFLSLDDRRLAALQLYLGCMGPCSGADRLQRWAHRRLNFGSEPAGWSNQLDTEILRNVNYAYQRKLLGAGGTARIWRTDLAAGGEVGLGNLATFAQAQLALRTGWNMPSGFAPTGDPAGRGIAMDPVFRPAEDSAATKWAYLAAIVRAAHFREYAPIAARGTKSGGFYPGLSPNGGEPELLLGLHAGAGRFALHVNYFRYIGSHHGLPPVSSPDWLSVSIDAHLHARKPGRR